MKKARIILGILCMITLIGGGIYIYQGKKNVDTEGPVLQAESDSITVSIQATDQELIQDVSAVDAQDGDVSDAILIENITKKEEGASNEFQITYVAFDRANNSGSLTRTLFYEDYRQSQFSLEQPLRFPENQKLSLLSYFKAEDCLDGDVSPFITLEGSSDILKDEPQKGFYDIKLSVTNSVGDTTELPLQVEIYEDSYEEQSFRPAVVLKHYIAYMEQGSELDTNAYLDHIQDKGMKIIDFDKEEDKDEDEETVQDTSMVNISEIHAESDVDINTPGVYSVVYTYTSETTGYDCNTRLIVVVE